MNNLEKDLEKLEELRQKVFKKATKTLVITAIVILFLVIIPSEQTLEELLCGVVGCIAIAFVIIFIITKRDRDKFNDFYKKTIVLNAFKKIFTDIEYDIEKGISYDKIASTQMIDMGSNFHSNDYIKAKYKNINFEFSDVHITEVRAQSAADRGYETVTLFKGQWFIFDFNKNFKTNIQVCANNFRNANTNFSSEIKFNKVHTEDMEFNNEFRIYAQNELDAFYILTPNTIEKIKELKRKSYGELLLCFIDNRLHVGLNNYKDLFEANILKKINFYDENNKIFSEIRIITEFIDTLGLDNNLFRKEV